MTAKISKTSSFLIILGAAALVISIFIPIWQIELAAPQYPEGLVMKIYSYKLGGDVEIINGLNHYIGMATLHTENFIEFKLLPFLIGFFAVLFLVTAFLKSKKMLIFTMISFILFGIVSMIDFYRWEYNYGHNLDPNAAIIVPGMAYQPPLIGYKKLLNFEAFSIPDIGGWLFIFAGVIIVVAFFLERKSKVNTVVATLVGLTLFISSCGTTNSEPIKLNQDKCDYCQMAIADGRFGAELITEKNRVYKFDDFHCMLDYSLENTKVPYKKYFVNDYKADNILIDATKAFYIKHENVKSPMGSNVAAFAAQEQAQEVANSFSTEVHDWEDIKKEQLNSTE